MPGPAPKPASKRRRVNKPASYGAAQPVVVPSAEGSAVGRELGFDDPHRLITDMWDTVQSSCESRFYSEADWERLRMELWHANRVMTGAQLSSRAWAAVQHGLTEMLISPAAKRRAAIELKPPGVDADEVAAVAVVGRYRQALKSV